MSVDLRVLLMILILSLSGMGVIVGRIWEKMVEIRKEFYAVADVIYEIEKRSDHDADGGAHEG